MGPPGQRRPPTPSKIALSSIQGRPSVSAEMHFAMWGISFSKPRAVRNGREWRRRWPWMAPSRDGVCAALAIKLSSGWGEDCEGGLESGGEGKMYRTWVLYNIADPVFYLAHGYIIYYFKFKHLNNLFWDVYYVQLINGEQRVLRCYMTWVL
jgi:hypothetical protein